MKFVFINVCANKSTGRIVQQKCRELMAQGHECRFAYGRDEQVPADIPGWKIGGRADMLFHGLETRLFDNHGFSSRLATRRFLEQLKQFDPDVIWMHNLHGYYIHAGMLFDYLRTCGKKIYWTLHDCWAYTGHCSHYQRVNCYRWKTGCGSCPQKEEYPTSIVDRSHANFLRKKAAFTGVPNLTIITPCSWLREELAQSFLAEYPVEVVYNTIDTNVFCPTPSDFRSRNGLEGKRVILGVSSMWDDTKGLSCFVRMSEQLDDSFRIVLVGLPEEIAKTMPGKIVPILRTENREELAAIYTAADLFVNPTTEDTYPTVNLEAAACGCRIVTYDTGGCAETITPQDVLIPRGDEASLLAAVRRHFE